MPKELTTAELEIEETNPSASSDIEAFSLIPFHLTITPVKGTSIVEDHTEEDTTIIILDPKDANFH